MASPHQSAGKICIICHEDCSSRPRLKDRAGHYYCKACYERAKKEIADRKRAAARKHAVATAAPPPPPESPPDFPLVDDGGLDALEAAAAETAAAAPIIVARPVAPVELPHRGLAVTTPGPAPRRQERSLAVPDALKQPWIAFAIPAFILGVLFIAARNNEDLAPMFLVPQTLFGLTVWVIVLVQAFREGIGTGFLTLCVPLYILYFVFSVNENPYIKALFAASILAGVASYWVGPSLDESMPAYPGY